MTARGGGWAAATASVRGASHERTGKPNQDAVRVVEVPGAGGGLVAAVCDGHGGDRYVRSDVGSRFGVEVACAVGRRLLKAPIDARDVEARLRSDVVGEIVERWKGRVIDDVASRPFTAEEERRAGARLDGDPLVSYGATLLLAILAEQWVGFVQIGDGDATAVSNGVATSPVPHDDRLVGGETTSLCLPTAVADARVAVISGRLPDLVMLSSDGYANSFASPTWRDDVGRDLLALVGRRGIDEVEAMLPEWLADSAAAAGDDVSMALAHRSVAVASPPAATAAPSGRRSLRPAAIIGGAAVVVGLGAGFLVGRASGADGANPAHDDGLGPVVTTTGTSMPELPPLTVGPATSTSEPAEADAPGTTVATDPILLELGADEQLVTFGGRSDGSGMLLVFDPSQITDTEARLVVRTAGPPRDVTLPSGWGFDDGRLSFRTAPVADVHSIGATLAAPYVWVVASDQRTLAAYEIGTGRLAGSVVIHDLTGEPLPPVSTVPGTPQASATTVDPATSTPAGSASASPDPSASTSIPISPNDDAMPSQSGGGS